MSIQFCLNVYKEFEQAQLQIARIKRLYPSASILTITDGTWDEGYGTYCDENEVICIRGDRLKLMEFGGRWTERMLKLFLETSSCETLLKIDPGDSRLNFPFKKIPNAELFGNIRVAGSRTHVQGGCIGLSRQGVKKILDSALLGSNLFCRRRYAYPPSEPPYNKVMPGAEKRKPGEPIEWITVEDVILYEIAEAIELTIEEWNEIYCHYLECLPNARERFAITHPDAIDY